jgi:hypothetical protein
MIIKALLIAGLLVALLYAFVHRNRSKVVTVAMAATSVAGIYFVLLPEHTTDIATLLGVGRGADLVLYCWLIITLVVSLSLQFKIMRLQDAVTALTRELALRAPLAAGEETRPASDQ